VRKVLAVLCELVDNQYVFVIFFTVECLEVMGRMK
jgi:hypothetical protein